MARPTLAERAIEAVLARSLQVGELTLVRTDGSERRFCGARPGPCATVVVRSPRAVSRIATGSALGLAEGYMHGEWDTPDLDAVLDLGIANIVARGERGPAPLRAPLLRLWHRLRDNDPGGARRNIRYHYDLGNGFYRLWLDETMTYSSALFDACTEPVHPDPLSCAQIRKWNRLLELLDLDPDDHLLEIGCGWGGFAIHAAATTGCRVTGLTLSTEQEAYAREAVKRAGLEDKVEIRLEDYRRVTGVYDRIASIEMFEAVGERWWPVFFERIRALLAPGGAAGIQVITIDERRFEEYRRNPDFIQRYIFPGGMLPSPERFAAAARSAGLRLGSPFFFARSYAATLAEWAQRFERAADAVAALGFDERFRRMWRYYLAYCRAGFSANTIDVMQVRLSA